MPWIAALWFLGFISPLLIISFIDLRHLIIPDKISIPFTLVGLLVRLVSEKFHQPAALLLDSFLGILLGAGVLLLVGKTYEWIQKREGIGLGDVKLAGMIGAFLGWKAVLVVFVLASILGSLVGIVMMIFFKRGLRSQIPFGPFLSLGALLFLFWGNSLLIFYFHGVQRLFNR
jgi:leader peptidase (prepilin peptidase)/N-methyltransferase